MHNEKNLKALPIGVSDYVKMQSEYYYIDKTLFIKEFLDRRPLVSLFTRPRRFGKTLNMDMFRVFFEMSEDDTGKYFSDKAIWKCGDYYRSYQGKYPVIFLSFKDIKFSTWEATLKKISELIQDEYGRHNELLSSTKLENYEKEYFRRIICGSYDEVELTSSLQRLSAMLKKHYDIAPIIIVDEYDSPIEEGYANNFYDEITGFMRVFFSGAFKDNKNITFGFLTGILRIAQESIFSGLNNLDVNTIMDNEYDKYFGFTKEEVSEMLSYYGALEKESELQGWYDGYLFGSKEIYNPWSVISYISKGCNPRAYWVSTGKNEILGDALKIANEDITEKLTALLSGEKIVARVNHNIAYKSLSEEPSNIYGLMLWAGYLKIQNKELQNDGSYLCEVMIPNKEIYSVYKSEIMSHLIQIGAIKRTTADKISESIYEKNTLKLQKSILEFMNNSISFYDAGTEGFYHGMLLGLISTTDNRYKISSNRESGDGRFDICMMPQDNKYPGIIMEIKWQKDLKKNALEKLASKALNQIIQNRYDMEMQNEGITQILKFGIAFSGKNICIKEGH